VNRAAIVGALLVILAGGAVLIAVIAALSEFPTPAGPAPGTGWIGVDLWGTRGLDLAVQAFLVLAGVFGVLFVLGNGGERR
jgi:hypothetical protein